jgi:hypothetical protein
MPTTLTVAEFLLVRVSVWLAMLMWFAGAWFRATSSAVPNQLATPGERAYHWLWLWSGLATWVHVLASYGFVHGWDHQAVLRQTAEESFQVTGIRADWGVYVNFLYATVLSIYSVVMVGLGRRVRGVDGWVYGFTAFIVFNATVVFKGGWLRLLAGMASLTVVGGHGLAWWRSAAGSTSATSSTSAAGSTSAASSTSAAPRGE